MAFDPHTTELFVVKAPAVSNSNNYVFEGSGGPLAPMGKRLIERGISKDVQSIAVDPVTPFGLRSILK